jgi:flavorubredoxin
MDYDRPVDIGTGVYWVGVFDALSLTHFNAYLIIDDDEAVLIDGGSRSGFASVVMKILQTGIVPSVIKALVFQNYNPRFTGSVLHLQDIIDRADLRIISDRTTHMFLRHDCKSDALFSLEDVNYKFTFSSGRRLEFIKMPFAHTAGSFATFDYKSSILFTGYLFGCEHSNWNLFLKLPPTCHTCTDYSNCAEKKEFCPITSVAGFHRSIMASERSLRYALERIAAVPFLTIAPQHGSIIHKPEDIVLICELLSTLKNVGIDGIIGDRSFFDLGDIKAVRERLYKTQAHHSG